MRHILPWAVLLLILAGCSSRQAVTKPTPEPVSTALQPQSATPAPIRPASPQAPAHRADSRPTFENIYFEFDRWNIQNEEKAVLVSAAEKLLRDAGLKFLIEGHCDERGTIEYNLALGAKRAESAKAFLVNLGIDSARLRTVTFGKERPADSGHDEAAWARNRRAEFKLIE